MTGIEEALAGKLQSSTQIVSAFAGAWPYITLGGVSQYAYWNDNVYAAEGEAVTVARQVDPSGSSTNIVIGRLGRPHPTEGVVLSADGSKAVVSVGATDVVAAYNSELLLAGGDTVRLMWQGRTATVMVKLTDYQPPPVSAPPQTAPPPTIQAGELSVFATDSVTWVPGLGWNNWAARNQNVYQGSYGSTTTGSWFYNGATKQLAGAFINRVRFRVPRRFNVGSYNNTGIMHVYVHASDNRPGTDVVRVMGPYELTIEPNFKGGFMDLPVAVGLQLINGGGISIAGNPYMGFAGKAEDPASGQLLILWSR